MSEWLIVGHGSVGSFVADRLAARGATVSVVDPAPRLPIAAGRRHLQPGDSLAAEFAVSCVGHAAAPLVPGVLDGLLRPDGLLFDWNSVAPRTKLEIRDAVAADTVDVALLDSLDGAVERPNLAVSGSRTADAVQVLQAHGFAAQAVGDEVGQAARLKYLRSVFMKGVEGLMVEYAALAAALDPGGVIHASIEANLGAQCMEFLDLLLATNRIHAERRSRELDDAVGTLADDGVDLVITPAVVDTLQRAAAAWALTDAPPAGSTTDELARHLRGALWPHPAST